MLRYFCFFILFAVSFGQNAFCQKKANGNLQYKSAVVRIFGCCDDKVFSGTGFIVDFHGGIITNYHVIKDCVRLIVVVKYNENLACFYDANILKIDKLNDLAFLKANIKNQPRPFELSTSEPSVLDDVVAFGFPALLDRPIIGNNLYKNNYYILENLEPNITKGAISKISATRITHNAIITYGSSGGPLINARTGQVVGVNFEGKKDSFSTFYFAVPINFVKKILDAPDGTGMLSRIPAQSISTDKTIAKSIAETPHPRILSKTSRQSPGTYPWRLNITASIFWVGKDNQKCDDDCWNSTWKKDFGGFDNPDPVCRTRDFRPKTFIPRQNPFYVALPLSGHYGRNSHCPLALCGILPHSPRPVVQIRGQQSLCQCRAGSREKIPSVTGRPSAPATGSHSAGAIEGSRETQKRVVSAIIVYSNKMG